MPQKKHTIKNASLSGGRYGYFTASTDLAGSEVDLDYLLQFKYARADGYRDHNGEEMYRPKGALGLQLNPELRFSGEYGFFTKEMELPGRVDQPTGNAIRENESSDFSAGLEWLGSDGKFLDAKVFGSLARSKESLTKKSLDDQGIGAGSSFSYDYLRWGVDVWTEKLQNFYSYQKGSVFGGVSGFPLREFLILDAVAGIDYYEGMFPRVSMKSNLNWYMSNRLWTFAGFKREMKIRSWSESYLTEYYVEGNQNEVRPERSIEGDAGVSCVLVKNYVSTLSFFISQKKDMLVWQDLDENGLFTLVNLNRARLMGVSLELQGRLWEKVQVTSKVMVQSIQNEDPFGEEVPYVPKIKYEFGLDWFLTDRWTLGSSVSYTGSQFVNEDAVGQIQDYILCDFKSSYQWKHLTFFVKVLNALDQRYDFYEGYPGPDTQYVAGVNLEY